MDKKEEEKIILRERKRIVKFLYAFGFDQDSVDAIEDGEYMELMKEYRKKGKENADS